MKEGGVFTHDELRVTTRETTDIWGIGLRQSIALGVFVLTHDTWDLHSRTLQQVLPVRWRLRRDKVTEYYEECRD